MKRQTITTIKKLLQYEIELASGYANMYAQSNQIEEVNYWSDRLLMAVYAERDLRKYLNRGHGKIKKILDRFNINDSTLSIISLSLCAFFSVLSLIIIYTFLCSFR